MSKHPEDCVCCECEDGREDAARERLFVGNTYVYRGPYPRPEQAKKVAPNQSPNLGVPKLGRAFRQAAA